MEAKLTIKSVRLLLVSYPVRHVVSVGLPVVVVEDHDGGDHTAGHHEHDAVEICS